MKLNTLEKLYLCMVNRSPEITLDEPMRLAAKASLEKMLAMSPKAAPAAK
jgi:quinolinate synthase